MGRGEKAEVAEYAQAQALLWLLFLLRTLGFVVLAPVLSARGAPPLARLGLILGPCCTLGIGLPAGCMGIFLRTGPANIPWVAKPFFGLIALLPMVFNRLFTGVIPVVLILLGMILGLLMAAGVALGWRYFPEEADLR